MVYRVPNRNGYRFIAFRGIYVFKKNGAKGLYFQLFFWTSIKICSCADSIRFNINSHKN